MVQLGASYAHVARILNCTKLTITWLIQHNRVTDRTADRPRSGKTCVTTANEDHYLHILHLRNRFLTVSSSVISHHTVRSWLWRHDIKAYWPFRCVTLTRQHRLWLYFGHDGFNVGNNGTGNVYSFMMAGLGYTNMQVRTALFRWICYGLGWFLWPSADRPYCHRCKSYHTQCYINQVLRPFLFLQPIHFNRTMSYLKLHISPLVVLWTVILFYGFYWVYSCFLLPNYYTYCPSADLQVNTEYKLFKCFIRYY